MIPITCDEHHIYRYGSRIVPSVTQILAASGAIDTTWFTPEARDRGRRVHDAIHAYTENPALGDCAGDEVRPYLQAYQAFVAISRARVVEAEGMVYCHAYGYAGRFDQYLEMDGQRVLVDLKTGVVQWWCALQTAAYTYALIESGRPVQKRLGVQLMANGQYRVTAYASMRNDFARFVTHLTMAKQQREVTCIRSLNQTMGLEHLQNG